LQNVLCNITESSSRHVPHLPQGSCGLVYLRQISAIYFIDTFRTSTGLRKSVILLAVLKFALVSQCWHDREWTLACFICSHN